MRWSMDNSSLSIDQSIFIEEDLLSQKADFGYFPISYPSYSFGENQQHCSILWLRRECTMLFVFAEKPDSWI